MRAVLILALALSACDRAPPAKPAAQAQATPAAATPAPAATPDTPTIRLLELAGDMRLGPAERARIAALEARERAADLAAAARDEAGVRDVLRRHDAAGPVARAKLRHALRVQLHYNRAKLTDPLPAALLDRHDPVLVEDAARHELVSMADIRAFGRSNAYVARIAGVAPPPMDEKPGERAELRRRYLADATLRTALTHAGVRHATMVAALDGLPAGKRAPIDRAIREVVHTPADVANVAREAENAVLAAEQRKAQRARDNAALADFRRWIARSNQLTIAMARFDSQMHVLDETDRLFH